MDPSKNPVDPNKSPPTGHNAPQPGGSSSSSSATSPAKRSNIVVNKNLMISFSDNLSLMHCVKPINIVPFVRFMVVVHKKYLGSSSWPLVKKRNID